MPRRRAAPKERMVGVTLKRKIPASQAARFKAQAQAMGYKTTVAKRRRRPPNLYGI